MHQTERSITPRVFEELLRERLAKDWERALKLFTDYGDLYSYDVTNVLMHAVSQGKVEEVLTKLEENWGEHFAWEHPERRHIGIDVATMLMFGELCKATLGLQPIEI